MATEVSTDVHDRINHLISELRALRAEMAQPATDPATGLAKKKVQLDTGRQLKNAVDEFRLFLWAYLDAWDTKADSPKARFQRIRMESAADMLATLAEEFRTAPLPASRETDKLRTQVDAIAPVLKRR